jgi:hypothetical protein
VQRKIDALGGWMFNGNMRTDYVKGNPQLFKPAEWLVDAGAAGCA